MALLFAMILEINKCPEGAEKTGNDRYIYVTEHLYF